MSPGTRSSRLLPRERPPVPGLSPERACALLRRCGEPAALLDGRGGFGDDWGGGARVALAPRVVLEHRRDAPDSGPDPLARLETLARSRLAHGGSADTGLLALLGYDLLDPAPRAARDDDGLPELVVLAVDRSLRFLPGGSLRVATWRGAAPDAQGEHDVERLLERLAANPEPDPAPGSPRPVGATTSLPRARYVAAVERVREHIRAGDVYQANLTQRFRAPFRGDALELYRGLAAETPAPRSAFLDTGRFALVSASPESFLTVRPDRRIETRPIKGTRPRGAGTPEDRRQARELLDSPKERAELTMIVDLERNDLGRVCETGSVEVPERGGLESYAAVHHLEARVVGTLRPDVGVAELLRATFPGGSITGAPKRRAIEILRELEPVRRGFFTGSLLWLGDDGSLVSSILIRSVVLAGGVAYLGAGGGIVADSDPEAEWHESNHKARAAARALGFRPEDAR